MLKILLVSNLYPNKFEPTRGVFTEQIVSNLKDHHQVEVIAPVPWLPSVLTRFKHNLSSSLPNSTFYKGTKVYHPKYLVIPKYGRWLYGILYFFGIFNTLRKVKKDFNPDVINVHWMYPDAFGAVLAARILKIPVVTHSLGCDINEYATYPSRRFFIKKALHWSDLNITVSDELTKKVISLGSPEQKTQTIMNGINKDLFTQQDKLSIRKELDLPRDKTILLFAGNFNIEKGLSILINAFAQIANKFPKSCLVVVGSGPLEKEIFDLVDALNLRERIYFKGRVDHSEVPSFLAAADFLCLPSLREGCPNIVLEALSTGTPVLSSRVGAVPEMLKSNENNFGLLAQPNDINDFSRILDQALSTSWKFPLKFQWMSWIESSNKIANALASVTIKEPTVPLS